MFDYALFPTDFSAYTDAVLSCLPELKAVGLREAVLLSVIRASDVPMPETVNRDSLEYWRWSLGEKLNIAKMALEGKGLIVRTGIAYGNSAEQIVHVAEEERVELIIMGAQGATASQELLLGSTAYEVVRRATVPVLLQKFETVRDLGHVKCHQVCEHMFKRILFPTDFSDCAEATFQLVKRLKAAGTEEVIVLHVKKERSRKNRLTEQVAEFDCHDAERLEALCKALRLFGLRAQPMLRQGTPSSETLEVSNEVEPGLIIVGLYARSALQGMMTSDSFDNVLRLSRLPVLAVRQLEAAHKRQVKKNERAM